jgi:hypothetical protein
MPPRKSSAWVFFSSLCVMSANPDQILERIVDNSWQDSLYVGHGGLNRISPQSQGLSRGVLQSALGLVDNLDLGISDCTEQPSPFAVIIPLDAIRLNRTQETCVMISMIFLRSTAQLDRNRGSQSFHATNPNDLWVEVQLDWQWGTDLTETLKR